MKPSERLFTALSNQKPDRVPVVPKIWVDLAANLTGTPLINLVTDPDVIPRILVEAGLDLGVDAVRTWSFPLRKIREENGAILEIDSTGKPIGTIDMLGGLATHLFDPRDYKLEDPHTIVHLRHWTCEKPIVQNLADAKRIYVPTPADYAAAGWAARFKKQLAQAGDKLAIIGDCDNPTLSACISLRGMDNALTDLLDDPELAEAIMDKGTEISIARAKFNIDTGLTNLRVNDSAANMSVISPALWRRFIKPRFTRFCSEVHAYNKNARIYCHICGNILPIVEDLIETGLDCIGPLDPLGGFTVAQVREKVGARVALMGGVNTLSFINSTPEQIIEEARACIEAGGQNGGYILGSGCVVPRSAKRENLLALVEAAKTHSPAANGAPMR